MMYSDRKYMYLMVFFDLPTNNREEKRYHASFRKMLENHGCFQFQYSIYVRVIKESKDVVQFRRFVRSFWNKSGRVSILTLTSRQFETMENLVGSDFAESFGIFDFKDDGNVEF